MSTIFDKILDGEIPCHRVYENDHVLAFLDIGPLSRGHTLVIPRRHVADWFDTIHEFPPGTYYDPRAGFVRYYEVPDISPSTTNSLGSDMYNYLIKVV